jgi:hypothetical protein
VRGGRVDVLGIGVDAVCGERPLSVSSGRCSECGDPGGAREAVGGAGESNISDMVRERREKTVGLSERRTSGLEAAMC